jgi:hypothetical protein
MLIIVGTVKPNTKNLLFTVNLLPSTYYRQLNFRTSPLTTAFAAAFPAASPVTIAGGITRRLPKMYRSQLTARPATSIFEKPLGVRQR